MLAKILLIFLVLAFVHPPADGFQVCSGREFEQLFVILKQLFQLFLNQLSMLCPRGGGGVPRDEVGTLNVLAHPMWGILAIFEHKCWPRDRSLRSKRFRRVWEQRKTEERGFRYFACAENEARAKKNNGGGSFPFLFPLFYSLHSSPCNSLLPNCTETLATQATGIGKFEQCKMKANRVLICGELGYECSAILKERRIPRGSSNFPVAIKMEEQKEFNKSLFFNIYVFVNNYFVSVPFSDVISIHAILLFFCDCWLIKCSS